MSDDLMRYDLLIENALRDVVRQTMTKVVKDGLPGEHHFYITFQTHAPGVAIPDDLRYAKYQAAAGAAGATPTGGVRF